MRLVKKNFFFIYIDKKTIQLVNFFVRYNSQIYRGSSVTHIYIKLILLLLLLLIWLARSKDLLLLRHALKFQNLQFCDSFKNATKILKKFQNVILVKKLFSLLPNLDMMVEY